MRRVPQLLARKTAPVIERRAVESEPQARQFLDIVTEAAVVHRSKRDAFKNALDRGDVDAAPQPDTNPWIDDTLVDKVNRHDEVNSAAYRELHRAHLGNTEMGLFGGEAGFEKSPRVFVDPDRPHLHSLYTTAPMNSNLRYIRYGRYKKDFALLDFDKLIRYARMLPSPMKILEDVVIAKCALSDHNAAALVMHHRRTAQGIVNPQQLDEFYPQAEALFERLVLTSLPPVEVGTKTHAEMLRVCAVHRKWHEGYNQYHRRFMELLEEENMLQKSDSTVRGQRRNLFPNKEHQQSKLQFTSQYADALMELCVACGPGHLDEATECMELLLATNVKPLESTIVGYMKAMQLEACVGKGGGRVMATPALGSELQRINNEQLRHMEEEAAQDAEASEGSSSPSPMQIMKPKKITGEQVEEIEQLLEYFDIRHTTDTVRELVGCWALVGDAMRAMTTLQAGDSADVKPDAMTFSWLLYAMRRQEGGSFIVRDLIGQLEPRGLAPTYEHFTFALMHCALCGDGPAALRLINNEIAAANIKWTPEMALLSLQAFATTSAGASLQMVEAAGAIIDNIESMSSWMDLSNDLYQNYFAVCATAGAAGAGLSMLKKLLSRDVSVTAQMLNALLFAVAIDQSAHGTPSSVVEVLTLLTASGIKPTKMTLVATDRCLERFGTDNKAMMEAVVTAKIPTAATASKVPKSKNKDAKNSGAAKKMRDTAADLNAQQAALDDDIPLRRFEVSPLELRDLSTPVQLSKEELHLRKQGGYANFGGNGHIKFGKVAAKVQPFDFEKGNYQEVSRPTYN